MSSFICEKCGAEILDTPDGYITECEHYPMEICSADLPTGPEELLPDWE